MSLSVNKFDRKKELSKKMKDLINKINWNIEEEQCNFLVQFYLMFFRDGGSEYPKVQHYLRPKQIERLLGDSINYKDKEFGYIPGNVFIWITALHGYTDEPEVDENGIISPRRTTPIHQAIKNCEEPRDWNLVTHCLFKIYNRFDVNYTDESGYTHFHAACQFQCHEVLQRFLEHGQDPNCIWPETGDSALHLISSCEELNMMVLLLRAGANPNVANKKGRTPLHTIAELPWDDEIEIEQFFLINDELNQLVHIDARDKLGKTPLHLASKEGWANMVEMLLRRGANPNLANDEGHTPLHVISASDYEFRADYLAEFFFKINDELNQRVQIDARDNLDRTPLQLAVENLRLHTVQSLLNRGADLSSFVFSNSSQFEERFKSIRHKDIRYKLRLASSLLAIIECLENRGYELDRSDALTIMKCFAKWELFEKSVDDEKLLRNDEEFKTAAKEIMVKPDLSLYELIHLRPQEAAKLLTYEDYCKFVWSNGLWVLPKESPRTACVVHLCEKLSRTFFLDWAMEPFIELTHYRLPILCCEMIIENLTNEDLYNICLAATGPKDKDGKIIVIKNALKRNNERPVRAREAPKRLKIE